MGNCFTKNGRRSCRRFLNYDGLSELLVYQGEVVVTGDLIGAILPTEGEEQWTGLQMTLSGTVLDPLPLFEQSLLE